MSHSASYKTKVLQQRRANQHYDRIAKAVKMIDFDHDKTHDGDKYLAGASLASGVAAVLTLSFKTGTKPSHLMYEWSSESDAAFTVREGGSWTTNTGTAIAVINANRDSAKESLWLEDKTATPAFGANMKILQDVTSPTGGTVLVPLSNHIWTDKKNDSSRGGLGELILAVDTAYTFAIAGADGDKGMGIHLGWYEHN